MNINGSSGCNGRFLETIRRECHASVIEITEFLGIRALDYIQYENDQIEPSGDIFKKLGEFYGCDAEYLGSAGQFGKKPDIIGKSKGK